MTIVIDIRQIVNSISHPNPILYVTDEYEKMCELKEKGCFVVPILNDATTDYDLSDYPFVITNPDEIDDDYYLKIWQRYAGLPWDIIKTGRCLIREMTENDVVALYEVYADPSITEYTEPLYPEYEDELTYTRNYIKNVYSYFGFGTWVIERLEDGQIIGRAGFNFRDGFESPELGFVIGKEYQRQGFAYEVCEAIINYGYEELGFTDIQALTIPENIASVNLLKKLGFSNKGQYKEYDVYVK